MQAKLVVLNLSQHTDSSDLLGGFRPVEARHSLAPLLPAFYSLVQGTWPRGRNDDYLSRVMKAAQRSKWNVVSKAVTAAVEKVGSSAALLTCSVRLLAKSRFLIMHRHLACSAWCIMSLFLPESPPYSCRGVCYCAIRLPSGRCLVGCEALSHTAAWHVMGVLPYVQIVTQRLASASLPLLCQQHLPDHC